MGFLFLFLIFSPLVSLSSLVLWPERPEVLVTSKFSGIVVRVCQVICGLHHLWVLGANVASGIPRTGVASGKQRSSKLKG